MAFDCTTGAIQETVAEVLVIADAVTAVGGLTGDGVTGTFARVKVLLIRMLPRVDWAFATAPLKPPALIAEVTLAGLAPGLAAKYRAAKPETCGVAIEVPLRVLLPVGSRWLSETIAEPGAKTSTHSPQFEYEARARALARFHADHGFV